MAETPSDSLANGSTVGLSSATFGPLPATNDSKSELESSALLSHNESASSSILESSSLSSTSKSSFTSRSILKNESRFSQSILSSDRASKYGTSGLSKPDTAVTDGESSYSSWRSSGSAASDSNKESLSDIMSRYSSSFSEGRGGSGGGYSSRFQSSLYGGSGGYGDDDEEDDDESSAGYRGSHGRQGLTRRRTFNNDTDDYSSYRRTLFGDRDGSDEGMDRFSHRRNYPETGRLSFRTRAPAPLLGDDEFMESSPRSLQSDPRHDDSHADDGDEDMDEKSGDVGDYYGSRRREIIGGRGKFGSSGQFRSSSYGGEESELYSPFSKKKFGRVSDYASRSHHRYNTPRDSDYGSTGGGAKDRTSLQRTASLPEGRRSKVAYSLIESQNYLLKNLNNMKSDLDDIDYEIRQVMKADKVLERKREALYHSISLEMQEDVPLEPEKRFESRFLNKRRQQQQQLLQLEGGEDGPGEAAEVDGDASMEATGAGLSSNFSGLSGSRFTRSATLGDPSSLQYSSAGAPARTSSKFHHRYDDGYDSPTYRSSPFRSIKDDDSADSGFSKFDGSSSGGYDYTMESSSYKRSLYRNKTTDLSPSGLHAQIKPDSIDAEYPSFSDFFNRARNIDNIKDLDALLSHKSKTASTNEPLADVKTTAVDAGNSVAAVESAAALRSTEGAGADSQSATDEANVPSSPLVVAASEGIAV